MEADYFVNGPSFVQISEIRVRPSPRNPIRVPTKGAACSIPGTGAANAGHGAGVGSDLRRFAKLIQRKLAFGKRIDIRFLDANSHRAATRCAHWFAALRVPHTERFSSSRSG